MTAANTYEVPLLRTSLPTCDFMATMIATLKVDLAPRITRHGVLVEVYGEGVLLLGESAAWARARPPSSWSSGATG